MESRFREQLRILHDCNANYDFYMHAAFVIRAGDEPNLVLSVLF